MPSVRRRVDLPARYLGAARAPSPGIRLKVQAIFADDGAEILIASVTIAEFARRMRDLGADEPAIRETLADHRALFSEVIAVDEAIAWAAFQIAAARRNACRWWMPSSLRRRKPGERAWSTATATWRPCPWISSTRSNCLIRFPDRTPSLRPTLTSRSHTVTVSR